MDHGWERNTVVSHRQPPYAWNQYRILQGITLSWMLLRFSPPPPSLWCFALACKHWGHPPPAAQLKFSEHVGGGGGGGCFPKATRECRNSGFNCLSECLLPPSASGKSFKSLLTVLFSPCPRVTRASLAYGLWSSPFFLFTQFRLESPQS